VGRRREGHRRVNRSADRARRPRGPPSREVRKQSEDEVEAVERRASEKIARARFAIYGTGVYPDATFTPRVNFGAVAGYKERGRTVTPFTTFGGTFDRATGEPPFDLPKRWLDARPRLNPRTPMDVCTTNDIIGGNSGSPLINRAGDVVGLVFDGNIYSLAGDFWYDGAQNRTIAVASVAILTALDKVYGAARLKQELSAP